MIHPQKILKEIGIRPRKKWGQNFLVHASTANKIVTWADIHPASTVLEIGPGLGALTQELGKQVKKVIAVDRDRKLISFLTSQFENESWFYPVCADVLTISLKEIAEKEKTKLHIAANLPYSLSTPILEHLTAERECISRMTLLLQNEVVDRICAERGTKEYGRLTIWMKTVWKTKKGPKISRNSFFPVPDVESRLVSFEAEKKTLIPEKDLSSFLDFVRKVFQQRRKTLRRILRDFEPSVEKLSKILEKSEIEGNRRPETLSLEEFSTLFRAFYHPPQEGC